MTPPRMEAGTSSLGGVSVLFCGRWYNGSGYRRKRPGGERLGNPHAVPRVTLDSLCRHGEKRKTGCLANIHLRHVFGFPLRGRGWGKFVPMENKATSSKP